ncbi:hypothetical protein Kisp01_27610 [Kineosporia sp. NBRC 101677]|uniref:hypothetical protein n=1 Tax=Kineosporia sp. NBRC 101677 TaxID=3032197 RepID=UPI0024A33E32|nr:hypothetical protein [Kineosporia sp. NBRC 101677]GLY15746.1 hypothetical protein Kisp01_27610 [Kineosporia sp. NBRC 101677]
MNAPAGPSLRRRLADAWITHRTRARVRAAEPQCAVTTCAEVAVNTPWSVVDEFKASRKLWCCSAEHHRIFWDHQYTGGV